MGEEVVPMLPRLYRLFIRRLVRRQRQSARSTRCGTMNHRIQIVSFQPWAVFLLLSSLLVYLRTFLSTSRVVDNMDEPLGKPRCDGHQLAWSVQKVLDRTHLCENSTNVAESVGFFVKVEYLCRPRNSGVEYRLVKHLWTEAVIRRYSCKRQAHVSVGPCPDDLDFWTRENFPNAIAFDAYFATSKEDLWRFVFRESAKILESVLAPRIILPLTRNREPALAAMRSHTESRSHMVMCPADVTARLLDTRDLFGGLTFPSVYVFDMTSASVSPPMRVPRSNLRSSTHDSLELEEILNRALLTSNRRTHDHRSASLFYLPISPALHCAQVANLAGDSVCTTAARDYMERVSKILEQDHAWKAALDAGTPIIFPFTLSAADCDGMADFVIPDFFESVVAVTRGFARAKSSKCDKDAIVAPYISSFVIRMLETPHVVRALPGNPTSIYFADGYDVYDGASNCKFECIFATYNERFEDHVRHIHTATFCVAMSSKADIQSLIVEYLTGGCIPVLHERSLWQLPFLGDIDYSKLILILPSSNVGYIVQYLRNVRENVIAERQRAGASHASLFVYDRCGSVLAHHATFTAAAAVKSCRAMRKLTQPAMKVDTFHTSTKPNSPLADFDVDIIFTWVNGSVPDHVQLREEFLRRESILSGHSGFAQDASRSQRFSDHEELRFALRSVSRNLPWIRKTYIVTCCGQVPHWLDRLSSEGIIVVDHSEIFLPTEAYPSFNSFAIEANLHRIAGLSEHFLVANDDYFIGKLLQKNDFFTPTGKPKISFQRNWGVVPKVDPTGLFAGMGYMWATRNVDKLLDTSFTIEKRFRVLHQATPVTKSLYKVAEKLFKRSFDRTRKNRFRSKADVIPYFLAVWVGIYSGDAVRLDKADELSNVLVNIRAPLNSSEIILRKLLSPCTPSIQHLVCEKSKPKMCLISKMDFQDSAYVYDPMDGLCKGPLRSIDGFLTMRSLEECIKECMLTRSPSSIGHIAVASQGPFALFTLGDMTSDLDGHDVHLEFGTLLSRFLCTYFKTPALWEIDDPCERMQQFS
jgi:hypothetical protein